MPSRSELVATLWKGRDPFLGFPLGLYPDSRNELYPPHPYIAEAIEETRAQFMVEIGVWKGNCTIAMAKMAKKLKIPNAVVLAIDTWLGSSEHWFSSWGESLNFEFGQPMLMRTFASNVVLSDVADVVLPIPLDSINAYEVFKRANLKEIDVLHIDAGHDYRSVMADLEAWWPLLRSGGWLVGDDYLDTGEWPEVKAAYDVFFKERNLFPLEFWSNKCRVKKP